MIYTTAVTLAASGSLISAVPGKRIRVLGIAMVALAATAVKLQSSGTPTDISGVFSFAANGGLVLPVTPDKIGWCDTLAGEALQANLSVATTVGFSIVYTLV